MRKAVYIFMIACLILFVGIFVFFSTMREFPYLRVGGKVQEDFYVRITASKKTAFLKAHEEELEYIKIGNTYFFVNAFALNDTQGRIRISACTLSPEDQTKNFVVRKVSMTKENGQTLYEIPDCNLVISPTSPENILPASKGLFTYDTTENWYQVGNRLLLTVEIEIDGKNTEISYDVEVCKYKIHVFLT